VTVKNVSFLRRAKEDEHVIRLLKKASSKNLPDTRALVKEIESTHAARLDRSLTASELLQSASRHLVEVSLSNGSRRSRLVEIKLHVFRWSSILEAAFEETADHLKDEYKGLLKEMRTAAERDGAIRRVLAPVLKVTKRLEAVIESADMAIDDIDQAAWRVKAVIEALNLVKQENDSGPRTKSRYSDD